MAAEASGAQRNVTAAGRLLAILDVFRIEPRPLSLAEIGRRAGQSTTTTHRLMHELLDWGAVEVCDDGRYRVGMKMLELAATSGAALSLRERAVPALLRLHRMIRVLVVHLAVRDGAESIYVESLRSAHGTVPTNRIGGRMPLHTTAAGRVLLAYADPAVQEEYLAGSLERRTGFTETDPAVLRAEFARVREQRWLITAKQVTGNTGGVAAPVFDNQERIVAAVGIVVNLAEGELHDYVGLVRTAADQITRALEDVDGFHGAEAAPHTPSRAPIVVRTGRDGSPTQEVPNP